ncbi:MAG: hypothetical protein HYV63_32070 [Candidatus Schekmanbacteria bacterium]|nr:hypothetical protein [Candidatus Schekmanbacteria bacterium]
MDSFFLLSVALAIAASLSLNVGKGVQKWKVRVLGAGRLAFTPPHRRDLAIWAAGVGLTTVASVLYSLALKFSDKPSIVSSLNGVGLIGLVLFAWAVLREPIGQKELGGAGCVLAGAFVVGYFDTPIGHAQEYSLHGFALGALGVVAVFGPLVLFSVRTRRMHGFTFGALAGVLIGMGMLLGDIALLRAGNDFFAQLRYPYPYAAVGIGTIALAFTQVAFWRSTAMVVVPTVSSFMILAPIAFEYLTFGTLLAPLQYAAVAVIIGGVVLLTTGEANGRSAEVAGQ